MNNINILSTPPEVKYGNNNEIIEVATFQVKGNNIVYVNGRKYVDVEALEALHRLQKEKNEPRVSSRQITAFLAAAGCILGGLGTTVCWTVSSSSSLLEKIVGSTIGIGVIIESAFFLKLAMDRMNTQSQK